MRSLILRAASCAGAAILISGCATKPESPGQGALVGFAQGLFACGPLGAIVCAPAGAVMGAVLGGIEESSRQSPAKAAQESRQSAPKAAEESRPSAAPTAQDWDAALAAAEWRHSRALDESRASHTCTAHDAKKKPIVRAQYAHPASPGGLVYVVEDSIAKVNAEEIAASLLINFNHVNSWGEMSVRRDITANCVKRTITELKRETFLSCDGGGSPNRTFQLSPPPVFGSRDAWVEVVLRNVCSPNA